MKYIILTLFLCFEVFSQSSKIYVPNEDSLAKRKTPEWFSNAKLGIFIHWGLYSVPAYAPPELDPGNVKDWKVFYENMPYAEWYLNAMQFEGSPTQKYHQKTYGKDFDYYDFIPLFNQNSKKWNPDTWADLFAEIGTKYVVLTTKHHDGFMLWPSKVPYPNYSPSKNNLVSERDLVGELSNAIRKKNIRMGLYYSGGLDWTFYKVPIDNVWPNLFMSLPQTPAYGSYVTAHYNELIEKYKPDLLWNDINFPDKGDFSGMLAYYYYKVPHGIINDRWNAKNKDIYGFQTPEYKIFEKKVDFKWETCRGLGNSFGYNMLEIEKHHISPDNLIDLLVDIVSKNGNLLLNIGPDAEGNIPQLQLSRLQSLGAWLKVNGEAIFDTKPHKVAEAENSQNIRIRYTVKGKDLYFIILDKLKSEKITINQLKCSQKAVFNVLGGKKEPLKWTQKGESIEISIPASSENEYATVIKIIDYNK